MDDLELKPCPFCGGRPTYNYDASMEPVGVYCVKCHAIIRFVRIRVKGDHEPFSVALEKIAEAWNRRAENG